MPTFHGIAWDFGVPEITDVQMDVTFHSDPACRPATNIDGIYVQLYDFRMFTDRPEFGGRGIYSYHGLQTNVFDANQRAWRGKGLLFSRFETSNKEDVRVAAGGWAEFPTPQHIKDEGGRFVGVRNSFDWGEGTYRLHFVPTDESAAGIWYEFKATNMDNGGAVSCGSLLFPAINGRRPLIPNRGSSWIEIYPPGQSHVVGPMVQGLQWLRDSQAVAWATAFFLHGGVSCRQARRQLFANILKILPIHAWIAATITTCLK